MKIEGIPEGWEAVRFDYVNDGESYLGGHGEIFVHLSSRPTRAKRLIIRKIEKPKKYRAFQDPAEASSLIGEKLRLKVNPKNEGLFIGITLHGFQIGLSLWTPQEAFESFERLDGTPFGVEVQS